MMTRQRKMDTKDTLAEILLKLPVVEILKKCRTSKTFRNICNDDKFWKRYAKENMSLTTKYSSTWKQQVLINAYLAKYIGGSVKKFDNLQYLVEVHIGFTSEEMTSIFGPCMSPENAEKYMSEKTGVDLGTLPQIETTDKVWVVSSNDVEICVTLYENGHVTFEGHYCSEYNKEKRLLHLIKFYLQIYKLRELLKGKKPDIENAALYLTELSEIFCIADHLRFDDSWFQKVAKQMGIEKKTTKTWRELVEAKRIEFETCKHQEEIPDESDDDEN